MMDENVNQKRFGWWAAFYIIIGAMVSLGGTVLTELYVIPAKEERIHKNEQKEYRLTRLYQPMMLAKGYGNLSMTSPGVFYKVKEIMESYSYLADQEVINKYIEFIQQCKFADYSDLKRGDDLFTGPLSDAVIIEFIRQGKPPMIWAASTRENALEIEKEFHEILEKHYRKARGDYFN